MTTATLIDGKRVAQDVQQQTAARVEKLKQAVGVTACLATVLVGEDPASAKYVAAKRRLCEKLGLASVFVKLDETTTTEQLVDKINELGRDANVHGILLQHPVPKQIDERAAFEAIPAQKDVDGVTFHSFGTMFYGLPGYESCTPGGIIRLLDAYDVDIRGKHAVVIGRSAILGKPMAGLLLNRDATVTVCHSRTVDLPELVKQADIVVAAVGKPAFVQGDWIKDGAVVIDAGFNPGPKGNIGDVDFEPASERAGLITPVPGGVGPMTLAVLVEQTSIAAARQAGVEI
ncbi:bifunctional 5,10-methylenetetrahydrofolate dehydrogenase/5,10-methenyltetrahydrofolate cyclohydrolase [Phycisphaerales bacterium AB-hyl4]|uniref:Bifunctional protein FolD n=1 Tax=Natronomicrosphaera hydrolytica TaxID=3242702 RepID=A0ABV4U318_9BACT